MSEYEKAEKKRKIDLLNMAAGDEVWVGSDRYPSSWEVKKIARVTDTMIVLEPLTGPGSYRNRYYRDGGYVVGKSFMAERVQKPATAAEVKEFKALKAKKRAEEDAHYAEQERRKHAADELNGILGDRKYVTHADRDAKGPEGDVWSLTIDGLSTAKVKQLAVFLQELL